MGKRGNSNVQETCEKIPNLINNKKNSNYKDRVHSYQSDRFGNNLVLPSKVGDAYTRPTYMRSFSTEKISTTENDSSDYFLNPPKDGIKLKTSIAMVNV